MTRREAWLSAGLVFLVALVVRVWAAGLIVFPKPEDVAYYAMVAENLLAGRGLVSDSIWSYYTPPLEFPRAAFEIWLPLPAFLAAIPMAILGSSFGAAQWSPVVMGSILAVLAWRLGADVAAERNFTPGRARSLALGAGLTAAVTLPLVLQSALTDSTIPFATLAVAACILMARLAREPGDPTVAGLGDYRPARLTDPRLIGLGLCLGLAALARNEAAWLALTWAFMAWTAVNVSRTERIRLIAVPATVAILVFAPWAARDWLVFGTPLPGQAISNAFSIAGTDIFAWNDPPTLERYLAVGPARLIEMRFLGLGHQLFNVLLLPGVVAAIGLLALPWQGRDRAVRALHLSALVTFLFTGLVFPVATTWGTYLHASGPAFILLIMAALLTLDAAIARLGRFRGWTRPVAWLAPALTIFAAAIFTLTLLPAYGDGTRGTARQYEALEPSLAAAGYPLGPGRPPVIHDFPVWLSVATGNESLALPNETPADVVDLARAFPGTELLVMLQAAQPDARGLWPGILDEGAPGSECFQELTLPMPPDPSLAAALESVRAWRIDCPAESGP